MGIFGQSNFSPSHHKRSKNGVKMFSKSFHVIVTLSLLFKASLCDQLSQHYSANSHKEQQVNEAYDYYKNLYLSFYGGDGQPSSAEGTLETGSIEEAGETPSFLEDTANKLKGVFHRQDQFGAAAPFGELDDSFIALAAAVLGGLALVGVLVNANNIYSLSTDQDAICTVVKDVGAASLTSISSTTSVDSTSELVTEFNKIITEINSWGTPSC